MPAEPAAAAPGVTGANESDDNQRTDTTTGTEVTDHELHEHVGEQETVGSRASALLEEMGISDEVQKSLSQAKGVAGEKATEEITDAKAKDDKEKAGGEGGRNTATSEEVGGGHAEAGKNDGAKAKAADKAKADDEEKPLTAEEKKSWPKEALDRIHKTTAQRETHKTARVEAERKAEEATQRATQLHQQLQSATRVRPEPTQRDPLADVQNPRDLQNAVKYYEDLLEFGEMNPDGATDVVVGKDAEGKPIRRDFSAQETAAMRVECGRILRHAVPAKEKWLGEQALHEQYARATLPALFEEGTEEYQAAEQLYRILPELRSRIPGHQQWVAWAMIGRQIVKQAMDQAKAKENGNGKNGSLSTKDSQLSTDPKVAPFLQKHAPLAPGVPISGAGVGVERRSKDSERTETVNKFVEEGGGDEALERLVERRRAQQTPKSKDAVLV